MMVTGDGNCLYQALGQTLTGEEQNHSTIQLLIQRFQNLNKDIFNELLTEINKPTIDEHVQHMGLPGTWGTHVEYLLLRITLESHFLRARSAETALGIPYNGKYSSHSFLNTSYVSLYQFLMIIVFYSH